MTTTAKTLGAALLAVAAGGAQAQFHTDRASFLAAMGTPPSIVLDFEGLIGTPEYPQNYPFGSGHYVLYPDGITVSGVGFFGLAETYLLGPDVDGGRYSLDGTTALAAGRWGMELTLPGARRAVGFDFAHDRASGGGGDGPLRMDVHLVGGGVASVVVTESAGAAFLGYVGGPIERVVFDSPDFSYTLYDNVVIGAPVPEPATYALLLLGVGALGLVRRRAGDARG